MANNNQISLQETWLSVDRDTDEAMYSSTCTINTYLEPEIETSVTVLSINEIVERTETDSGPQRDKTPPCVTLQQAVQDNSIEIVDEWIEILSMKSDEAKRKKLDEKDVYGMAAIHYAAKYNHYSILVKLCENGADATLATTEELFTPLHYAAYYIPPYQIDDHDLQLYSQESIDHLSPSKKTIDFLTGLPEVNVNVGDKFKVSPLHLACRRSNIEAAEILLSHHAIIPDIKDEHDDTPLHEACVHGSDVIVDMLLENSTVLFNFYDSFNKDRQTPLHLACMEGHTSIVKKLLAKCPKEKITSLVDACDRRGNTAFHLTVESLGLSSRKDTGIICVLLDYGANPSVGNVSNDNTICPEGTVNKQAIRTTPLHIAARHGLEEVIEILLADKRVFPNIADVNNQSPLHFAAMHNQPRAVSALIRRGANPELKDVNSCTPFLLAAACGHNEVVKVLSECTRITNLDRNRRSAVFLAAEGAHQLLLGDLIKFCGPSTLKLCSTPDIHLNTPLHIAAKLGHLNIVEELLKDELVKSGYVKLDVRNKSKKTPVHLAAENGHVKILKRLTAKSKALVLHEDEEGNTPLHLAASKGWKHSVILLLERGASVDARNVSLATPLSLAADSGHVKTVKMLLHFKAEVDIRDRNQATPLHYAVSKDHVDVVKVLMSSGAKCSLKDKDGNNALDRAIDHGHEDVAKVIISSSQWEEALKNTTFGSSGRKHYATTPFRKMITKMPDVARDVLNRCTSCCEGDNGEKVTIYNYQYIEDIRQPRQDKPTIADKVPFKWAKQVYLAWINRHFRSEKENSNTWGPQIFDKYNHPLTIMAANDDGKLISHPLVISLLMFKLRKYATFYYLVHLFFHLLFVLFLTTFALTAFNPNSETCKVVFQGKFGSYKNAENMSELLDQHGNDSMRLQALYGQCELDVHHYQAISVTARTSAALAVIRFILFIAISSVKRITEFIMNLRSWIEIPMFICSIIFVSVFETECHCPTAWQWQVGTIAILLLWIDLINVVRKLQVFDIGIYVLMFVSIIKTFFHTVFLSVLLLISFSLAFFMAFFQPGMDFSPLSNPGQSILTVMAYTVGGMDYNGLFSLSHDNINEAEHLDVPFLPISILLWVIFLVIMIILLVNMLIGLAVDDIRGIKRAAEVQRLKLLVDLTLSVDSVLIYRHLFRVPERKIKQNRISLWKACNTFLWKGNIVQDTPEIIAKAMEKNNEPSVEQVHNNTNALVKEIASMKESLRAMSDRNRRIETAITQLSTIFVNKFNYSPNPDYEFRSLQDGV